MKNLTASRVIVVAVLLGLVARLALVGGPGFGFDRGFAAQVTAMRLTGSTLTAAAIAATWAGSAYATLGLTALTSAAKWLRGHHGTAIWLVLTVGVGRLIADGTKLLVDRPRPDFTPFPVPVSSSSFPSGHAMNSMVAFGALALALAPARFRGIALTLAVGLSLLIGLTRPYLGVHWGSDVLGGWLLGGAVLIFAAAFKPGSSRTAT